MITITQIIFRLLIASVLCGFIGLERESKHRPAGLRTNILVGMGSALVMLVSIEMAALYPGVEPSRIASGVITGIGFLGAGVIIRGQSQGNKNDDIIHGITTAATVWVVSVIGLAVGLGFYYAAVAATALVLIFLFIFDSEKIREKLGKK